MLVQRRPDVLRLMTQHDHALAAGAMAAAWVGVDRAPGGTLAPRLIVATALHDSGWRGTDRTPSLEEAEGLPRSFSDLPPQEKWSFLEGAIEGLESVDPEVADLVRLHHRTLEGETPDEGALPVDLQWLRLFDALSLFVCLTPPGTVEEARPPWLGSPFPLPGGGRLHVEWRSEDRLRVRPWPFAGLQLGLELPYRDVPAGPFRSVQELRSAWERARRERWSPTLEP